MIYNAMLKRKNAVETNYQQNVLNDGKKQRSFCFFLQINSMIVLRCGLPVFNQLYQTVITDMLTFATFSGTRTYLDILLEIPSQKKKSSLVIF